MNSRTQASLSAGVSARRVVQWLKATNLEIPVQVSFDIGVVIGRLSSFEGSDWLKHVEEAYPDD